MIQMIPFEAMDSSVLSHRHYDRDAEILMLVFRGKDGGPSNKLYKYGNVSAALYEAGLAFISPATGEPSFGSWFQRVIKPNRDQYPYTAIELDVNEIAALRKIIVGRPTEIGTTSLEGGATLEDVASIPRNQTIDFSSGQPIPVAESPAQDQVEDTERLAKARAEYDRLLTDPDAPVKVLDAAMAEYMAAQEEAVQGQITELHTKMALVGKVTETSIVIATEDGARLAQVTGNAIARMREVLERTLRPEIRRLYAPYKTALDILNRYDKPLERDQNLLRAALASFGREQRRLAEEEQARMRREQAAQAQREADAKAQDLQLNDAIAAEQRGEPALAQSILESPALPLAPTMPAPARVAPAIPKEVDKGLREKWEWEVEDSSKIPDEFWMLDEKAINKVVTTMKGRANTLIPGIRAFDAGTAAFSKKAKE